MCSYSNKEPLKFYADQNPKCVTSKGKTLPFGSLFFVFLSSTGFFAGAKAFWEEVNPKLDLGHLRIELVPLSKVSNLATEMT